MDDEDKKMYLIFRVYNKEEMKDHDSRFRYYGWSTLKNVVKSFLKQRDSTKYKVITHDYSVEGVDSSYDDFSEFTGVDYLDDKYMINFIKLRSSKSDMEVTFLTTADELREAEIRIQRMMIDKASFSSTDGITDNAVDILRLFVNLKQHYSDLLYYIGYRPRDLEFMFNMNEPYEDTINNSIDCAYEGFAEFPQEENNYIPEPPGLSTLDDVSNKILYSIEAFVKVLMEDL